MWSHDDRGWPHIPNITKPNDVYWCDEIEAWQWVRPSGVGSWPTCSQASAGPLLYVCILSPPLVWSTPLDLAGRWHAPTFNKGHKKKKKKVTLHILTHGAMRGCGLTSLVVCINAKIRDTRERNVTIGNEIWTTNLRSLGFRDTREWVILRGLILWI